jgi:arabinofuranosyltransferase
MSSKTTFRLGLFGALVTFAFFVWQFQFLCDDGYISFRYAFNLASGHGLVFNLDEMPPVEGYTEFLWVLILAAVHRLGLNPEFWSQAITALGGCILVLRVHQSAVRQFGAAPWAVHLTTWLCATCIPLAVWSTSGMSTMLFVLACFLTLDFLIGYPRQRNLLFACLAATVTVLLRADGAVWIAYVGTAAFVCSVFQRDKALARSAVIMSFTALAVFLAHTLWRWNYYGDWLPNTARVKLGVSSFTLMRGAHYAASFALVFPGLLLAWIATPILGAKRLTGFAWIAWGSVPLMVAYSIITGGDYMCFGRFLLPCLPPLLLAFGSGIARHVGPERGGFKKYSVVAGALLVMSLGLPAAGNQFCTSTSLLESMAYRFNARKPDGSPLVRTEREQWQAMRDRALEWKSLGRAVALHTDEGDSLVVQAIGAIGYFSQRRLYDQFGLVSPEILSEPRPKITTPQNRRSPGHDQYVNPTWFMPQKPTWLGASLLLDGQPVPAGLRPKWDRVVNLPASQGFDPGTRLLLVAAKL